MNTSSLQRKGPGGDDQRYRSNAIKDNEKFKSKVREKENLGENRRPKNRSIRDLRDCLIDHHVAKTTWN